MVSEETLVLLEAPPGPGTGVEAGEPHGYALAETFQRGKRQERKVSPPSLCPLFLSLPTSSFPPSFLPLCLLLPPLPSPLPLFPPLLLSLHPALPLSVPSPEASAPAPAAPSPSPQPPNPSVSAHWLVGRSSLSDPDSPLSLGRLRGSVRLLPVLPPPCPPRGPQLLGVATGMTGPWTRPPAAGLLPPTPERKLRGPKRVWSMHDARHTRSTVILNMEGDMITMTMEGTT